MSDSDFATFVWYETIHGTAERKHHQSHTSQVLGFSITLLQPADGRTTNHALIGELNYKKTRECGLGLWLPQPTR